MRKISVRLLLFVASALLLAACAASMQYMKYVQSVDKALQAGQYRAASKKVDKARKLHLYSKHDKLLFYLDKGIIEHYAGNYEVSNRYFEKAEQTMEKLFTHSISQSAASFLWNDNVIDYWGEVYERLYVNVFKALNYSHLGNIEDALVEIRKVNIKLQEMDDKYGSALQEAAKKQKLKMDDNAPFYSDVIAHYLSSLFYLAEDEEDNSLISLRKLKKAWETQPSVYDFSMPKLVAIKRRKAANTVDIIAFTGTAPKKKASGGKITTYKDYIGISDLSQPVALPNIPFPGAKPGWHFKFAFPTIHVTPSRIHEIQIFVDGKKAGSLSLLEDMGRVAEHTFEKHKNMIYLKTVLRTVTKGIAAAEAKKKLKKDAEADFILGAFIDMAVDAGVDASEQADLRCWNTMPQKCYIGQIRFPKGKHTVQAKFFDKNRALVEVQTIENVELSETMNLLEFISLN